MSLLKIKTKPLKYEIIVQRARVERVSDNLKTKVSRIHPSIKKVFSKKPQNNLNNHLNGRVDVSFIRVRPSSNSNISSLNSASSNYTSVSSNSNGNVNGELHQLKYQKIFDNPNSKMVFLPDVGPQVSYHSNVNILPAMGNNHKWEFPYKPTTVYHPGSIKFEITQYPSITMEYIPNMLSEE